MSGSSTAAGIAELVSTKSVLTTPQTALWLPQIMFPGKPVANTGWAVTIEGALDPRLFAEAIRRLVAETDALRLSLSIDGDTVYQQVRDYTDYAIQHVDVSSVADPDEAARHWIARLSPPPDPLVEGDRRRTECALTGRSLQISQAIGRAEFERLRVFAKSLDSSLPRLLLALIAIAFFRLTGNRDFVLGVALH